MSIVIFGGDKMPEHVNTSRRALYRNLGVKINDMLTNDKLLGCHLSYALRVGCLDRVKIFNFKAIYLDFVDRDPSSCTPKSSNRMLCPCARSLGTTGSLEPNYFPISLLLTFMTLEQFREYQLRKHPKILMAPTVTIENRSLALS
uniref:Uncharacterized protein n=1 Tax=Glossina austeni TaxID=7395 RepID=A0A1A9UJB4_GLOAU